MSQHSLNKDTGIFIFFLNMNTGIFMGFFYPPCRGLYVVALSLVQSAACEYHVMMWGVTVMITLH